MTLPTTEDSKTTPSIQIELVWNIQSASLTQELSGFWLQHKALPSQQAATIRARQVVAIARQQGRIVGVSSVEKAWNEKLHCYLWNFRSFVHPQLRSNHVGTQLILAVRDFLAQRYAQGEDADTVGLFVTIENPALQQQRNQAIWPNSRLIFVGFNEKGQHERVFFFENARIPAQPVYRPVNKPSPTV